MKKYTVTPFWYHVEEKRAIISIKKYFGLLILYEYRK